MWQFYNIFECTRFYDINHSTNYLCNINYPQYLIPSTGRWTQPTMKAPLTPTVSELADPEEPTFLALMPVSLPVGDGIE